MISALCQLVNFQHKPAQRRVETTMQLNSVSATLFTLKGPEVLIFWVEKCGKTGTNDRK